jgi:acetate kinase
MALDSFTYRIALFAGSLATAMGGIDGLVFTAGIGENAAPIRERVAARLAWLGLDFDPMTNRNGGPRVSRSGSSIACYVIPTDEELMIGRHTLDALRTGPRG